MSTLYDQVDSGEVDMKKADTLANIAGKYLKAEQLALAREIFMDSRSRGRAPALPNGATVPLLPAVEGPH
jgi:hypothetical protein